MSLATAHPDFGVALVNLGCRVNRVELDVIAQRLLDAGCSIVDRSHADAVVVNTCAVTGEAEAKTRKAVRRAANLPQRPLVVATGCVASLFAEELAVLGDNVLVEPAKARVPQVVVELLAERHGEASKSGSFDAAPSLMVGPASITPTGRTRPGIKVQDGCDNRCSFCIVWKARGPSRSVGVTEVVRQVRSELAAGAREVVLTGINLGNYRDAGDGGSSVDLPGLIRTILDETDVGRLRLSSIEPPDVSDELLETMAAAGDRVAPFLHVCLQSGCDRTLRDMRRVYDTRRYATLVEHARAALPDLSLGCDLIVGFPGESDADFEQSYAFCEEMCFSRMHIFRYSKRPGTPAADRPDQIEPHVSALRAERMGHLAMRMRAAEAERRVGKEELVLVQAPGRGVSGGLFDVLVDDQLAVGDLVHTCPVAVCDGDVLDARRMT